MTDQKKPGDTNRFINYITKAKTNRSIIKKIMPQFVVDDLCKLTEGKHNDQKS